MPIPMPLQKAAMNSILQTALWRGMCLALILQSGPTSSLTCSIGSTFDASHASLELAFTDFDYWYVVGLSSPLDPQTMGDVEQLTFHAVESTIAWCIATSTAMYTPVVALTPGLMDQEQTALPCPSNTTDRSAFSRWATRASTDCVVIRGSMRILTRGRTKDDQDLSFTIAKLRHSLKLSMENGLGQNGEVPGVTFLGYLGESLGGTSNDGVDKGTNISMGIGTTDNGSGNEGETDTELSSKDGNGGDVEQSGWNIASHDTAPSGNVQVVDGSSGAGGTSGNDASIRGGLADGHAGAVETGGDTAQSSRGATAGVSVPVSKANEEQSAYDDHGRWLLIVCTATPIILVVLGVAFLMRKRRITRENSLVPIETATKDANDNEVVETFVGPDFACESQFNTSTGTESDNGSSSHLLRQTVDSVISNQINFVINTTFAQHSSCDDEQYPVKTCGQAHGIENHQSSFVETSENSSSHSSNSRIVRISETEEYFDEESSGN